MSREFPGGFTRCHPSAESDMMRKNNSERVEGGKGDVRKIIKVVENARKELRTVDVASLTGRKDRVERILGNTEKGAELDTIPNALPMDDVADESRFLSRPQKRGESKQAGGTSTTRGMGPMRKNRQNTNRGLGELVG